MQHLQPNSTLQGGKYKIEKVLGQGGFGITYLAENTMLDGKVAIKEFFFREYCERDEETSRVTIGTSGNRDITDRFKTKFIKEARAIFKLNHPNIVRILDIFEENGTAYYVMDFIEGESLGDMVKRRGAIPEMEAVGYIKEVASALQYIHSKSMNHLDIKPNNIMKRKEDGQILLIDFGVAKQYDTETSEGTTTTPVGISHGYSPAEQYLKNGVQSFSPQSDVYALAATLYKLLTGVTPPEAMIVQDEGFPKYDLVSRGISQTVISTIGAAMRSRRQRTQNIEAFIANLKSTSTPEEVESTLFIPEVQQKDKGVNHKNIIGFAAIFIILTTCVASFFFFGKGKDDSTVWNSVDSIAYDLGVAQSEGLRQYMSVQLGVDSIFIDEFISGMEDGATGDSGEIPAETKARDAYIKGLEVGKQVQQMVKGLSNEVYAGDSTQTVNVNVLLAGLIDGLKGKANMTGEEAMAAFNEKLEPIKNANLEKLFGENKKAGETYLAENAKKEGVTTLPSGVQYKILASGIGKAPSETATISVNYEGKLVDGTIFDSSYERNQPFEVNLSEPRVIPGWVEILKKMPKGAKWEVSIPYDQAYGTQNMGQIKPFSTLIFTIERIK